ncbi:MAG: class I SAM-dependent methyltransferase [Ignavibacteriae bacterium]|nr:class I SAM-dependent methyltransferase [Ignavibacteriota bacterium]
MSDSWYVVAAMTQDNTHPLPPSAFYDAAASSYDTMTAFTERVPREAAILQPLVSRFRIRSAADMGCGTGIHVCALSSLGIKTTGYDISAEMLRRARSNAAVYTDAQFVLGDFLAPALLNSEPVDAVFCLGNSLPHLASSDELVQTFAQWREALNSGGRAIVQLLNYERILAIRDRIIAVRSDPGTTIVRFYDFTEPRLTFNILSVDTTTQPPRHMLHSTLLTPFTTSIIQEAAITAGFTSAGLFSTLALEQWDPRSRDLVVVLETR